jgi:ABC-type antimicrobial peptide transport system permease subunit
MRQTLHDLIQLSLKRQKKGKKRMIVFEKLFNWLFFIGIILLFGRVLTLIFRLMHMPFTTFFKDYSVISLTILIIGVIGSEVVKSMKKKKK